MRRTMLALDREEVLEKGIEDVGGNLGSPLFVDFRFVPVSVEAEGRVGQVFRKRLPVISFALEHATDLTTGVHLVSSPG